MQSPRELIEEVKPGEEEEQQEEQADDGFDGQVLIRRGEAPIYV